jgi:glycogen operon protein
MAAATDRVVAETGSPEPLGAHAADGGVNFAVFAPEAERVSVCLFSADGHETTRIELPGETGGVRHGFVPGIVAGQQYGYRAAGKYEPSMGLRFNEQKLLLDPYTRALAGRFAWHDAVFDFDLGTVAGVQRAAEHGDAGTAGGRPPEVLVASPLDSAPHVPRSVVTVSADPAGHCRTPWSETLIYELNVRGFTMRHPAVEGAARGTVAALGQRELLAHLQALGITTVELMPLHACIDEEFLVARGLRNFWGYNPCAFFAPEPRLLGPDGVGGLRRAVASLHDANIEVLLDVVFNHTAETGRLGPTISLRGLANAEYYRLRPEDPGAYINDTGCGNTLNADSPVVRRLIVDALRHWVRDIGMDGFRFDLASILGRTASGFSREHPLFAEIAADSVLAGCKLIAEPWDVGPGGYQLGAFPNGWAEWNDQFRDAARRFWRGDPGSAAALARRIHGSADIFEGGGRGPLASVNYVASHDGFTTADVVSYAERHNEANGEGNRDGHEHNFSVNHGVEGATDDPAILAARRRHRLNLLATALLAQGTPMLLAGDELGHSQSGNNNAYAQDNGIGWLDWSRLEMDRAFFDEICALARLRRELPLLRQSQYRHGEPAAATGLKDIVWFDVDGAPLGPEAWNGTRTLGLLLSRPDSWNAEEHPVPAVALLINSGDRDCEFRLPEVAGPGRWHRRWSSDAGQGPAVNDRCALGRFAIACLSYEPAT